MQTTVLRYSRSKTPEFFSGATRDDVKWTIHYLIGLLDKPEVHISNKKNMMSITEAKAILRQRKLKSRNVPADFNGMRDEVNPKYL